VSVVTEKKLKVRYTPPSAPITASNARARFYATSFVSLAVNLDRSSQASGTACALAGCSGKVTVDLGFNAVELTQEMQSTPAPDASMFASLCTQSTTLNFGGGLGYAPGPNGGISPAGAMQASWNYTVGSDTALGTAEKLWIVDKFFCLQPPTVPAGANSVTVDVLLTGTATASAKSESAKQAQGKGSVELRMLKLEFPDGCVDCEPPSNPSGPGQVGG
jgi:hypothetical protein